MTTTPEQPRDRNLETCNFAGRTTTVRRGHKMVKLLHINPESHDDHWMWRCECGVDGATHPQGQADHLQPADRAITSWRNHAKGLPYGKTGRKTSKAASLVTVKEQD